MTTNDVKGILYKIVKASALGTIPVYRDVHPPVTSKATATERIVINCLGLNNAPWKKGYANVNIFVPYSSDPIKPDSDALYDTPNTVRLSALETIATELFKSIYDETKGSCLIRSEEIKQEEDKPTWSYFINVRLKIQVENFKL